MLWNLTQKCRKGACPEFRPQGQPLQPLTWQKYNYITAMPNDDYWGAGIPMFKQNIPTWPYFGV